MPMMFPWQQLWQTGQQRTRARRLLPGRLTSRPRLEELEARCVPAVITVTTLQDETINNGLVSLREAIQAANTNTSVDGSTPGDSGADTIVFKHGLSGTINLTNQLQITEDLTISGPGASDLTINGGQQGFRVFDITN